MMRLPDDLILKSVPLKDQYFDLRGLNAYAALSVSCLRNHIKASDLPCYVVGGKILVRKTELDAWLQRFRVNRTQDLDKLADEVLEEIGYTSRRSSKSKD